MSRRLLATLALVVGSASLVACGGSDGSAARPASERVVVTERFPLAKADLLARVVPDASGPQTGEITLRAVEVPGIRLAEADYEAKVVRVLLATNADPGRVRDALASIPGIASVE